MGPLPSYECVCCGRWIVTVEYRGREAWYRLATPAPDPAMPGARYVVGEVKGIQALEDLLRREAGIGVGNLREVKPGRAS